MKTVVLLSGGLDSTLALFSCLAQTEGFSGDVLALSFRYGQIHEVELRSAREVAEIAGVPFHEQDLSGALTVPDEPGAVVPARNLMFLASAANFAVSHHEGDLVRIVIGACADDDVGFPDCRDEFFVAVQNALTVAGIGVTVRRPFVRLTKGEAIKDTFEVVGKHGNDAVAKLKEALSISWSCYEPYDHPGIERPCGFCNACRFRADGFSEAGMEDPLCW